MLQLPEQLEPELLLEQFTHGGLTHAYLTLDDDHPFLSMTHSVSPIFQYGLSAWRRKRAEHGIDSVGQRFEIVPALEQMYNPPLSDIVGKGAQARGDESERRRAEQHPGERIALVRVETRRDEDQLRFVLCENGKNELVDRAQVLALPAPGGQREIHRIPGSGAGTDIGGPAGSRIVRRLVKRDVEDVASVCEDVFGTVAVMNVPVDDRDPVEPGGESIGCCDRHIVQQAEAHGPVVLCVVTRRAHCDERIDRLAGDCGPRRGDSTPGGEARGEPRMPVGARVGVEHGTIAVGRGFELIDVGRCVYAFDLGATDGIAGDDLAGNAVVSRFDATHDRRYALGSLGMTRPVVVQKALLIVVNSEVHRRKTTPDARERSIDKSIDPVDASKSTP